MNVINNSESKEMYLETVYKLEKNHGHAHVVDIAKALGVSKPSVTKAIKKLRDEKVVNTQKYGTITLTKKGRDISEKIYSKHKLIEKFLMQSLELSSDDANINACKMEHIVSDEMVEAIKEFLDKK